MSKTSAQRIERCSTIIKPLGRGRYGARVFYDGHMIMQDNRARSRIEAVKNLKELLRMTDKMGYDCPMAAASRFRRKKRRP